MTTGRSPDFLDSLRDLVSRDEPAAALAQLANALAAVDRSLHNETLVHLSRLRDIGRRERRGVVDPAGAAVERNRVKLAVLELLDVVSGRLAPGSLPFRTADVALAPPQEASLEKIVGANNLQSIAWLARGLDAARSVCRIAAPGGVGTGFLADDGNLWTNNHVLPSKEETVASRAEFNFELDTSNRLMPVTAYEFDPDSFRTDPALDVSTARLRPAPKGPPLDSWGRLRLAKDAAPRTGEHVTIIQHPQGGPKQIAVTANQVVNVFEHRLQYTTDTLPGSSGSPVFNDDWQVVAIHHAGGNLITNARGDRMFANEGILVSAILRR